MSQRQLLWKDQGWADFVLGEQLVEESHFEYYLTKSAASEAMAKYADAPSSYIVILSKIESIGK